MTPSRRTLIASVGLAGLTTAALQGCSSPENVAAGPVSLPATDVPVGSGLIVKNSEFVVTQPTEGSFKAFDRTCPHQGCPVSEVVKTDIVCNCHGSRFSITDGSVVQGPAATGLTPAKVSEASGTLTVTSA